MVDILTNAHDDILLACWQETHDEALALNWLESIHDLPRAQTLQQQLDFTPKALTASLRLVALGLIPSTPEVQQQAVTWRAEMKPYRCQHCGIAMQDMHWNCPQCHTWGQCHVQESNKETL